MAFGEPIGSESRSSTTYNGGKTVPLPCNKVNKTIGAVRPDFQGAGAESTSECICATPPSKIACEAKYKDPFVGTPTLRKGDVTYQETTTCESDGVCTTVYTKQQPAPGGGTATEYCVETITEREKPCTETIAYLPEAEILNDCVCPHEDGGPVTDHHYPGPLTNHDEATDWATIQHMNMTSQIDCGSCDGP